MLKVFGKDYVCHDKAARLNTSLASHLVDTEVVEKLNAGLKSYREHDAGGKHA